MASKIEKTLELNITHEILSLTERFQWILTPLHLRKYWQPYDNRVPKIPEMPFAQGLYISQEGRKGGGWDVSITAPSYNNSPSRVLFLQFKAGEHKDFCDNSKSKFFGSKDSHNQCVEFEFGKKKQHKLLRELSKKVGTKDAVLYAFPRLVTVEHVKNNLGKLLHKTTFLSIPDMDKEAKDKGIDIDDGNAHKFRACYNDPYKYEANFFIFFFEGQYDYSSVLAELITIRVMRVLESLKSTLRNEGEFIYTYNIADAFGYLLNELIVYSGLRDVNLTINNTILAEYRRISRHLRIEQILQEEVSLDLIMGQNFVLEVIKNLEPYFALTKESRFDKNTIIPDAPQKFTFKVGKEGITFSLEGEYDNEDFEDITYSIF